LVICPPLPRRLTRRVQPTRAPDAFLTTPADSKTVFRPSRIYLWRKTEARRTAKARTHAPSRHFFAYPVFPAEIRLKTGYAAFLFSQLFRTTSDAPALGRNAYGSYDLGETRPGCAFKNADAMHLWSSSRQVDRRPQKFAAENDITRKVFLQLFKAAEAARAVPPAPCQIDPVLKKTRNRYRNPRSLDLVMKKAETDTGTRSDFKTGLGICFDLLRGRS